MKSRLKRLRLRVSPALVVAIFALVVATSSSATAAFVVTSKHIKKNAVTAKHIKKKAVKPKHLAPKIKRQLAASGAPGPKGDTGPAGAPGQNGVSGYEVVSGDPVTVDGYAVAPAYGIGQAVAICPAGKRALGGGGHWQYQNGTFTDNNTITNSGPRFSIFLAGLPGQPGWWSHASPNGNNANSWVVNGKNGDDNDERQLVAWVICANVG